MQVHVQLEVKEGALRFHDLDDGVVRSDAVRLALGYFEDLGEMNASRSVTYLRDMFDPKIQLVVARLKWEKRELLRVHAMTSLHRTFNLLHYMSADGLVK